MDHPKHDGPAINEDLWQAWVEKGKRNQRATARKARVVVAVAVVLLGVCAGFLTLR